MTSQPTVPNPWDAAVQNALGTGNVAPLNLSGAAGLFEDARQFNSSLQLQADQFNTANQLTVDQVNAANQQRAAEANQAARLRVAETNASLRAQQAQLGEQVRQFDVQDARERENMRFLLRKEQVATEEGNRVAFQNAVALQEQISSRLENNRFQRQQLVTEVKGLNSQIENNVRVFNAQEAGRVEQLNEQRRQANLQQLQSVSSQIGELAQNPADVGKLAAFLRSGNPAAISSAIARGDNAITDESLLGLRGLLGAREGLQQGPTQATGNFINADLIDVPQFGEVGQAPAVEDLFQQINFDPSGVERGPSQAAGDFSQNFEGIQLPPEVQAQLVNLPPEVQAQIIAASGGAGTLPTTAGPAPTQQEVTDLPVGGQVQAPDGKVYTNYGAPNGGLSGLPEAEYRKVPEFVTDAYGLPPAKEFGQSPSAPTSEPSSVSRESLTEKGWNVGENLSDEQIAKFFEGFGRGGTAAPGQPVIVGDSSDGKENQELAMVDARGNLVVTPLDRLPRAEEGGLFTTDQGLPEFRRRQSADSRRTFTPSTTRIGSPEELARVVEEAGRDSMQYQTAQPISRPAVPSSLTAPGSPTPPSAAPAVQPPRAVQQRPPQAVAPAAGTGQIGPVSADVARLFLSDVQRDALRRGGFSDPTQVSPIRVSAPGTSRFLQDLSASVAGTMGFGPSSLFFEELQRLQPQGVRSGVGRRTA